MKIIKKVKTIDVKRSYVIANQIASPLLVRKNHNSKNFIKTISLKEFKKRLSSAISKILRMPEKKLDYIISKEYKIRLDAYNASDWYLAKVKTSEIGLWRRAGKMPVSWTSGTLKETSRIADRAIKFNLKGIKDRPKYAIKNILNTNVNYLQKEKYLFPIVFKHNTGTKGRKWLKKPVKVDMDDGCIRSIAMAIAGIDTLKVYFGIPKD